MNQGKTDFWIDVDSVADTAAKQGKWRRFRPRWNLLTLILVASVVCTWSLYYRLRHDNARLRVGIQTMEGQSRKLRIEHPDRLAVVRLPASWYDETKWDVAVPSEKAVAAGGWKGSNPWRRRGRWSLGFAEAIPRRRGSPASCDPAPKESI